MPQLPLYRSDEIGADSHQTSLYLHESVVNCMLWGLYRSNLLKYNLTEGARAAQPHSVLACPS